MDLRRDVKAEALSYQSDQGKLVSAVVIHLAYDTDLVAGRYIYTGGPPDTVTPSSVLSPPRR